MIRILIAAGTFLLHLATSWRYGYFRDELYFIACSKHLAWGYVDQPPLVAIAALISAPFHYNLVVLRLLPMVCATLAVVVAMQIAKELGGGVFAQTLAGVAVALTPAYLLLGNTLTTTSFEALSWTLVIWLVTRLLRNPGGAKAWLALAGAIAFGLYGKYSMALLVAAIFVGLLLTPQRRILATRWMPISVITALVLVAPNLVWQAQHGWPFFEVLRGDAAHRHAFNTGLALEYQSFIPNAVAFASEQLLYTNPLAVPVWLAGLIVPFTWPQMRELRFISIAYVALFVMAVLLEAKGYYVIGIYAALLAVGAVAFERAATWVRTAEFATLALVAVLTMPLSLPVLPIHEFIAYTALLGMTGRNGEPPRLVQPVYAEEFGWDRLARDVSKFYNALAPGTRALTGIYADTYADAGAIDLFGPKYGLPPAISSQNTY